MASPFRTPVNWRSGPPVVGGPSNAPAPIYRAGQAPAVVRQSPPRGFPQRIPLPPYRPSAPAVMRKAAPQVGAPPVFRPVLTGAAPPGKTNWPPVYTPTALVQRAAVPATKAGRPPRPHPGPALQRKGNLLTQMAMTRLTTQNANTVAEFTLDGVSIAKVHNTSVADNPTFHASLARRAGRLGIPYTPIPNTSDAPHAEDKILDSLFEMGQGLAAKTTLSIRMNKAPCQRCATNLLAAAGKYGLKLRFKVSWISADGWDGVKLLAQHGIDFRYWTEEAREAKNWTANSSSASFRITDRVEAVKGMARGKTVAKNWKARQTEEIARLQREHPTWARNVTASWKDRGISFSNYRDITMSLAEAMPAVYDENYSEGMDLGGEIFG